MTKPSSTLSYAARQKKRAKSLKIGWLIQQPLWKILAIAITDMRKQERAPKSVLQMDTWFETNGKCVACAAGSVLRWSFSCTTNLKYQKMANTDNGVTIRCVIDDLRKGDVRSALLWLRRSPAGFSHFTIEPYGSDREGFWRDIRALQKRLRAANI